MSLVEERRQPYFVVFHMRVDLICTAQLFLTNKSSVLIVFLNFENQHL